MASLPFLLSPALLATASPSPLSCVIFKLKFPFHLQPLPYPEKSAVLILPRHPSVLFWSILELV